MKLLPPSKDVCQMCAEDHPPEFPHNPSSTFWQYWFYGKNGRWPKREDAFAHCTEDMKMAWDEEERAVRSEYEQ